MFFLFFVFLSLISICLFSFVLNILFFLFRNEKEKNGYKFFYYLFLILFFVWFGNVVFEVLNNNDNIFIILECFGLFCFVLCSSYCLGELVIRLVERKRILLSKSFFRKVVLFFCLAFFSISQVAWFFGIGYVIPVVFRPDYYEFKSLCKLNTLPNNEEKYNKILAIWDTNFKDLDFEYLQKILHPSYRKKDEFVASPLKSMENFVLKIELSIFTQQEYISPKNIQSMEISVSWNLDRSKIYASSDRVIFDLNRFASSIDCRKIMSF